MIVEEKIFKGVGKVADRMNELGLKMHTVQIVDWNPQFAILYYDTDDTSTPGAHTTPFHRGPGRPPNPPKEAA